MTRLLIRLFCFVAVLFSGAGISLAVVAEGAAVVTAGDGLVNRAASFGERVADWSRRLAAEV